MEQLPHELPQAFLKRESTVAHAVISFLAKSGVRRIYGLTGSHVKPLWNEAFFAGIDIIDVRNEVAAVHMAKADAELTGELAVAIVTTGPGFTNALTGIANAHHSRTPILVLSGLPSRPQLGLGALEELDQVAMAEPVSRWAGTVTNARQVVPFLHSAFNAALGNEGLPGPAFMDFPTDVLRAPLPIELQGPTTWAPRGRTIMIASQKQIEFAAEAIRAARRPLLISGRDAVRDSMGLLRFLEASGAIYLDAGDSRCGVPADHPAYVPAVRSQAMSEADLVITAGRRLDFALGYGSPAVFEHAKAFVRLGQTSEEVAGARPADIAVWGNVRSSLARLADMDIRPKDLDTDWITGLQSSDRVKQTSARARARANPTAEDGLLHPAAVMAALSDCVDPNRAMFIGDGGDNLSWARVGLSPAPILDPGTFGCLGVGIPFAVAASLIYPDKQVVAVMGDGSFSFNALEMDTARRVGAKPVFVVNNNRAWNIERLDQVENYDNNVFGTVLPDTSYTGIAEGMGIRAEAVTSAENLVPAIKRALEDPPALVEIIISGEPRSPDFRSGLADLPDYQAIKPWNDKEVEIWKASITVALLHGPCRTDLANIISPGSDQSIGVSMTDSRSPG